MNDKLDELLVKDDISIDDIRRCLCGAFSYYQYSHWKYGLFNEYAYSKKMNLDYIKEPISYQPINYIVYIIRNKEVDINDLEKVKDKFQQEKDYKKIYEFINFLSNIRFERGRYAKSEIVEMKTFYENIKVLTSELINTFLSLYSSEIEYMSCYYKLTLIHTNEYSKDLVNAVLESNDINNICSFMIGEEEYTHDMLGYGLSDEICRHIIRKEKLEKMIDPYIDSFSRNISNINESNDYYPVLYALTVSDKLRQKYSNLYQKLYNFYIGKSYVNVGILHRIEVKSLYNIGDINKAELIHSIFISKMNKEIAEEKIKENKSNISKKLTLISQKKSNN